MGRRLRLWLWGYRHALSRMQSQRSEAAPKRPPGFADDDYRGGRSPHWIKVKNRTHHAFDRVKGAFAGS
jgi:hypothetical protein